MNAFYDLGIYGKETIVSNFMSWVLNPNETHNLGDKVISKFFKKIELNLDYDSVNIIREYYGKVRTKNNFIDIVIEVIRDSQIVAVIAIENKVFSREGLKQTERYWELLNEKYVGMRIIPIYLTLENIPVYLSSNKFIHMKYSELSEIFSSVKEEVKLIDDFIEAYIDRKKEKAEVERLNSIDLKELIDIDGWNTTNDCVCRMISYILNDSSNDMLALYDYSARGGKTFFCVTSSQWNIFVDEIECNIHLEGDINKLLIHFEVVPYKPISQLNEIEKNSFMIGRNLYREYFAEQLNGNDNFVVKSINGNDKLTIYKLENKSITFSDYLDSIKDLYNQVNQILSSHNTTVSDIPM